MTECPERHGPARSAFSQPAAGGLVEELGSGEDAGGSLCKAREIFSAVLSMLRYNSF